MNTVFHIAEVSRLGAGAVEIFKRHGAQSGEHIAISLQSLQAALAEIDLADSPNGAGDVLAGVLTPLAGVLDAMLGTNLKNCPGCKRRQAKLNRLMPLTPKE